MAIGTCGCSSCCQALASLQQTGCACSSAVPQSCPSPCVLLLRWVLAGSNRAGTRAVCPGLPLPEQQMELGFCPLKMMWDTESLFQHSHFSHLWWFEGCGCGGGEHAAAAAELLWFGPPQLCLSPAIRPVLAVPCLLIVLSALSPSLAQPPVPWETAKSEI